MGNNWQYSFERGVKLRLESELDARMHGLPFDSSNIPFHSHDGTMQSRFKSGWQSLTPVDIDMYIKKEIGEPCGLREIKRQLREAKCSS